MGGGRRRRGGHGGGRGRRPGRRRAGHGGARRGGGRPGRGGGAVVAAAAVLQHVATFTAAAATLLTAVDRIGDGAFDWGGPLLWGFGLAWLAASPCLRAERLDESAPIMAAGGSRRTGNGCATAGARAGGIWGARGAGLGAGRPRRRGRPAVRAERACHMARRRIPRRRRAGRRRGTGPAPWVAAVGIGGVFVSVPLAVAELFDARLGPLVGILAVGLALVAAAVVLTRRAAR